MARNLAEQYIEEGKKRGMEAAETMARNLAEKYMEEGERRGMVRAKQDDLIGLMAEKFGSVPDRIIRRVRSMEDTETLDQSLKRLMHANSLEEMQV